jgi:hypothetical protein
MVESYVQSRFSFFSYTEVAFQNVTFAFLEVHKKNSFIDTLTSCLPKKIPVRFYIHSIISDQAIIEVLILR